MASSRSWFALALAGVLGLFYVGHGLHGGVGELSGNAAFGQEAAAEQRIKWERIYGGLSDKDGRTRLLPTVARTKIPGGWLIYMRSTGPEGGLGITFMPDADHKWDGKSLE
jgi:hypothetical protein